jgi:hypothetical protein
MNRDWDIRGQATHRQCPKCHAALDWAPLDGPAARIARARRQHFNDCPAAALDPVKLVKMSGAEVEAVLAEENTNGST